MAKMILAYVPVLHQGYRELLERHLDANVFWVWGEELIGEFDHLYRKDIRALSPQAAILALKGWGLIAVEIASRETLRSLNRSRAHVVMPDEDEGRVIAEKYLGDCRIEFGTVFLRWDNTKITRPFEVRADLSVTEEDFAEHALGLAFREAGKSSDWWRQIGAVAARGNEVLLVAHNKHVPSPHLPYVLGDPRAHFKKGIGLEFYTSLHAEAGVIAEAARRGISLEGADLYTTTFPCPSCAKLLAYTGIRRLFFHEGYAVLDGESILKARGIEIIHIE